MTFIIYLFIVIPASVAILWRLFSRKTRPIDLVKETVLITGGMKLKRTLIFNHLEQVHREWDCHWQENLSPLEQL